MAAKLYSFRIDESELIDMKQVARVYSMSVTDLIKNAIDRYMADLRKDPFYRLTENIEDADKAETEEILAQIDNMTEDDLKITSAKYFSI